MPNINLIPGGIVATVKEKGYLFLDNYLQNDLLKSLLKESESLNFEFGNHLDYPINKGKMNEVKQLHNRSYHFLDDILVPETSKYCRSLGKVFTDFLPMDCNWLPNELGFQIYAEENHWISPHRDRKSDKLLSLTLTLGGEAKINIYKPNSTPVDYTKLTKIDEHLTKPKTAMFLRAPGLGNGGQIIHEVEPPTKLPRLILNLRMRETLLKSPKEMQKE